MREQHGPDAASIAACLARWYALDVERVAFLPLGNDLQAAVYRVEAGDGERYFVKARAGPVSAAGLDLPRALLDRGVANVLAPIRARDGALWAPLDDHDGWTVVLFPFVEGQSAKIAGMSAAQWRTFGAALRGVHGSGLGEAIRARLRVEDFTLPAASRVRELLVEAGISVDADSVAGEFAAFWRAQADRIRAVLARAEELGRELRGRTFDLALCHGDIHLTNVLVGDDGRIWLVDWDAPLIAPRERDLLFVVGSRIGRRPTRQEEDWFFEGYGPTAVDPVALVYYRYERRLEDLAETGWRVVHHQGLSAATRAAEAAAARAFFDSGGDFDVIETVARRRWGLPAMRGSA